MKKRRALKHSLTIMILCSLCQCHLQDAGPIYVKDGKEYGKIQGPFRHRWWNYYKRGLSYIEGEFYQEAISDLKEAIKQREEDQRTARTYGMHFIDYFAHRELGVVYYQTQKFEVAERELELSLSQYPTAKTRFYLDLVRKARIEQQGVEVTPPDLMLDATTDEFWTREDPVVVSGITQDEQYVAGVTIKSIPLFLEGSVKRIPFTELLDLSQGRHVIEVEARNLLGKVTKRSLIIHVDRQGPIITLDELQIDQSATAKGVTISGFIYDEAGVSELFINSRKITIRDGVESPFRTRIRVGIDKLDLVARDRLGNQTAAQISISPFSTSQGPTLLACADFGVGGSLLVGLFGPSDTQPPTIWLKGWADTQTVFLEKVYFEGQVRDESEIESLRINQIPILRRSGRSIVFSHLVELREGENIITIEARDAAGNVASKAISVIRHIPKALQLDERLSLSVLPFEQKGDVSEFSFSFQDNLIDALVNRNRFRIVEREKLDLILQEQKLSRTKLIDRNAALRLGRLVAAKSIVTGSIIETRSGIEIVGRMVDTETSEILATEDVYSEVKDLPALRTLAEGMAIKFHREFPLLQGVVVHRKGKYIFTDLGQKEIKVQRRLIVYREKPIIEKSGKVLGVDNEIIGRARVKQVLPEMSKAELLSEKTAAIRAMDRIVTE